MGQKRAAHDGQIGIRPDEPLRVGVGEGEQPVDRPVGDGHGAVHRRRHDEVLGKITVGREPPGPFLAGKLHRAHIPVAGPGAGKAPIGGAPPAEDTVITSGSQRCRAVAIRTEGSRGSIRGRVVAAGIGRARRLLGDGPLAHCALARSPGNGPRILLRLGQVDGDLQRPRGRISHPRGVFHRAHGRRSARTPGAPRVTSRQAA